jgi:hypothetical protein
MRMMIPYLPKSLQSPLNSFCTKCFFFLSLSLSLSLSQGLLFTNCLGPTNYTFQNIKGNFQNSDTISNISIFLTHQPNYNKQHDLQNLQYLFSCFWPVKNPFQFALNELNKLFYSFTRGITDDSGRCKITILLLILL